MSRGLRVVRFGVVLGVLGALALVLSPIGYRAGLWDLRVSLYYLLGGAMLLGTLGWVVSLAGGYLVRGGARRHLALALVGAALGLAVAGYPAAQVVKARSVPPIHDVTTDTADPPQFFALADARRVAPNGLAYGGAGVAEMQKQAYPDLATYQSLVAPAELLAVAAKVAANLGWVVAEASSHDGRIEATDTTRMFGFKDDIVIRIRPAPSGRGSELDIRSVSRLGSSDLGANAARIRSFLERLRANGG